MNWINSLLSRHQPFSLFVARRAVTSHPTYCQQNTVWPQPVFPLLRKTKSDKTVWCQKKNDSKNRNKKKSPNTLLNRTSQTARTVYSFDLGPVAVSGYRWARNSIPIPRRQLCTNKYLNVARQTEKCHGNSCKLNADTPKQQWKKIKSGPNRLRGPPKVKRTTGYIPK